MLVYTSCLANYLPKARILGHSLKQFHPDWKFVVVLGEPWPDGEPENKEPFDAVVYYEDLGIPDLSAWIFKHSIVEICTAVKGFALCHFFDAFDADKVIYLDPDIQVFNSLDEIDRWLDKYDILLVPHHLKPHDELHMIESNELCQMRHGIYNLGFAAFARRDEGIACARWWRDRLYHFCRNDVSAGLFTDQRWCDFIPSFFSNYHIIKDPGYDAASWNLTDRRLWKDQDGAVYANSSPLRFYHFTGYDSGAGRSVIAHYVHDMPVVAELWDAYDRLHQENGQDRLRDHTWPLACFDDGTRITQHMRDIYRQRDDLQKTFPNPFSTQSKRNFLNWYSQNTVDPGEAATADNTDILKNSYAWRFIGRKLYYLECRLRNALNQNNRTSRAIRKVLLMFRDRFRAINNRWRRPSALLRLTAVFLTLLSLCFEIPAEAARRLIKKKAQKSTLGRLDLYPVETLQRSGRFLSADGRPKVLYDLFFCRGVHGGGEYGKSVFLSLCAEAVGGRIVLCVAAQPDNSIEDYYWNSIADARIPVIPVSCYEDVTDLVNRDLFDCFFTPALVVYTGYIYQCRCGGDLSFKSGRTRVIGVIHDVRDVELALERDRYLTFRKDAGLLPEAAFPPEKLEEKTRSAQEEAEKHKQMYRGIFQNASVGTVITVSRYSEKTLKSILGGNGDKTLTLYAPMKNKTKPERFQIHGRDPADFAFALMVNAARWEKNGAGAVLAFDRYCDADPRCAVTFLVLGVGGFHELGVAKLDHPERFVFLNGFIGNGRLEYLYSHAAFLVYPSFGEGFGYPPLEIMAYGKPSLVAETSAIPEICGDAAVYCDPYDIGSIQAGFGKIIADPPSEKDLQRRYQQITAKQHRDLEQLISLLKQKDLHIVKV